MRSLIRSSIAALLVIGVPLVAPGPASAAKKLTTISFTATVDDVDDRSGKLCFDIAPGALITGTYTYDSEAKDTNSDPTVGDYGYDSAPNGITIRAGGQQTSSAPTNTQFLVELVNRDTDNYLLRSYTNRPWSCGTPVEHIAWQLDDPSGMALKSDKLTKKPPKLKSFQSVFGLTIESSRDYGDYGYFIRAHVTSVR